MLYGTLLWHACDSGGTLWSCVDRARLERFIRLQNDLLANVAVALPYRGVSDPTALPIDPRIGA